MMNVTYLLQGTPLLHLTLPYLPTSFNHLSNLLPLCPPISFFHKKCRNAWHLKRYHADPKQTAEQHKSRTPQHEKCSNRKTQLGEHPSIKPQYQVSTSSTRLNCCRCQNTAGCRDCMGRPCAGQPTNASEPAYCSKTQLRYCRIFIVMKYKQHKRG